MTMTTATTTTTAAPPAEAVRVLLAIHPEARRHDGLASRERVILVSADIGAHDENNADCGALAKDLCERMRSLPRPASPRALAEAATAALTGRRPELIVSFTLVELHAESATIMNCGGHRVVSVTEPVACLIADGFIDSDDPKLRSIVQHACGPELAVDVERIHVRRVRYDEAPLIVICPLGDLPHLGDLAGCTGLEEVAQRVEAHAPRRLMALVAIASPSHRRRS